MTIVTTDVALHAPATAELPGGDAVCQAAGPGLLSAGYTTAGGSPAEAAWIAANVHPESFFCRPPTKPADITAGIPGLCRYRPFFKRFNVYPTRFEAVWYDDRDVVGVSPGTADYALLQTYCPPLLPQSCGADYRPVGPEPIAALSK